MYRGASLAVQWLRLCTPNAGGAGLIPGRGTRILHATWSRLKKKKKKKKDTYTTQGSRFNKITFTASSRAL